MGLAASTEASNAPMVVVPAGEFLMGANDARPDEKPQRRVFLKAFSIDKFPVTNQQFQKLGMKPANDYGKQFSGPGQPVVGVTWNQAKEFCEKVGKRLPTEAEWEKAARGTDGRKYPWGNSWDLNKLITGINSGGKPHPIQRDYKKHGTPFGAVDMVGNVTEWVADWYGETYYQKSPTQNPKGPASGEKKVARGGNWKFSYDGLFRVSARARSEPATSFNYVGFRCAK